MSNDFDDLIIRRGSHSYKWDSSSDENVLPMWIADMDFKTAPPVIEALKKRVEHGVFGYTKVPSSYYDALIGWFSRRHNFNFEKTWVLSTTGTIPALSATIKALTQPGDKVIVQPPVYNHFFSSVRNNKCEMVSNNLSYINGIYSIDLEDLEKKAADSKTKVLLLCNPHNPAGRVWKKEELLKLGEICLKHDVIVVADEIHCDLVYPGHQYVPFASMGREFLNNSVTCLAPSKTFNLAGLQVSNIIAADEEIRKKIDRALNDNEVCEINPFAVEALIAAYNEGESWVDDLKKYLYENYLYVADHFSRHLPQLKVVPLEGTYLVWIECSALKLSSSDIAKRLLHDEQLWLNEGTIYGAAGEGFIRLNIACPRSRLVDGLDRIRKVFG